MLVMTLGIVILPAVSAGIMKVHVDDRVLSIQDERPAVPQKAKKLPAGTKVETIILNEIPANRKVTKESTTTTLEVDTTESTATQNIPEL